MQKSDASQAKLLHGEYKVPGGKLVTVDLKVDTENKISYVSVAGDFFLEPDEALTRINQALLGLDQSTSTTEIGKAIEENLLATDILFGVSPLAIAKAIRRALGYALSWEDLEFEVIVGPKLHPLENMALDQILPERLAQGLRRPLLRIWDWDEPLLVMGSFQSYENEVNPAGLEKHGIVVSRRITGGGTMFMEAGNCITYSLVIPTALTDGLSFAESYPFLDQWVMGALEKIGVKAKYVPLNDIASEQGKIGGAAQKRFANGTMVHHVTMAYDIDAVKMHECMRIGKEKIRDKGIRSAVKRVDPMRSQTGMSREDIIAAFVDHFKSLYNCYDSSLTESEIEAAKELSQTKFRDPEWIHRVP